IDLLINDDPIDTHADLALMQEATHHCRMGCGLDVGVVQYDQWSVTTKFEGYALDVFSADSNAPHTAADVCRSCKRNQAWNGVFYEGITDFGTGANNHVYHSWREASFLEQMSYQKATSDSRIASWLQDYGIA